MKNNIEIFNYLSLINPKLATMFKIKRRNPFPTNFVLTEDDIEQRLKLNKLQKFIVLPKFVFFEKKIIKNNLKNSLKNIKKIIKNQFFENFSPIFKEKINFYLNNRKIITKNILNNFKKYDFNEIDSLREIYSLDPIFGELLEDLFNKEVDLQKLLLDLEEKYTLSYLEKIKILEVKTKKAKQKTMQNIKTNQNIEKRLESKENLKKNTKNMVKPKNNQEKSTMREKEKL